VPRRDTRTTIVWEAAAATNQQEWGPPAGAERVEEAEDHQPDGRRSARNIGCRRKIPS